MDEAERFGADWPDVALALIVFAREDTWSFLLASAALSAVLWPLYFALPQKLKKDYSFRDKIKSGKRRRKGKKKNE